ncbi:antirestriction protein [Trabulsiella guamensis ATCC 49490]|uniref:Antirestriction protein n=1 Tax=Trabulsiella guamensis ATCC 49490 TaxID=1005994 RepID=A0A085AA34_9ENTR|nr:zincin-like metallopeptidase domain-containing protein [Trabulsiella guamensis]KFC07079.1 antirestriction protein [Trabulsiella guamensis ATCC 49490]
MTMNQYTQTSTSDTAAATSVSPLDLSGSSKTKFSQNKTDIYQTVTDSIIKALESGVKPWKCPWKRNGLVSGIPSNYTTYEAYSGINIMLLWSSAAQQGFQDSRWMTYNQAKSIGAQVRKGERGTMAICYKTLEKERDDGEIDRIPMLRHFIVFNAQQIDGLPLDGSDVQPVQPAGNIFAPLPQAEELFKRSGAKITERGQQAFFRPATDEIFLPERHLFSRAEDFYATGLHELVHWSGHKTRLNRDMTGRFGSEGYAAEELVAELGSAFLMADMGITGDVQHESYIASWLKKLRDDKRYIFQAASTASKAHRYLMAL